MSQHDRPGFKSGAALNFCGQKIADAAEALMAEFVFSGCAQYRCAMRIRAGCELCSFSYNYDVEESAAGMPLFQSGRDLFDIERPFRNQDSVSATRDPAI